ncbi:MAG: glycosyltransferase family 2 protein [Phycisphaeraceae bacterium]|nr:glycosyltransferase family 2 protein [Phycisphaeraceae bacterium]
MNKVELSILIVCWQSREDIVACLGSVREHTKRTGYEVLLINNSDDGLEDFITEQYPWAKVVENDQNLGFASGNNRLAEVAQGEYLLLLNPDTWHDGPAIDTLMGFARSTPEGGLWGGVTYLPDGKIDPGCNQCLPTLWNAVLQYMKLGRFCWRGPKRDRSFEAEVPVISGAYMLARASAWREVEGFDPTFVMYSDEADLCTRIRQAGYKIMMTSKSNITHNVGSGNPDNPGRLAARARGRMTYFRKHAGALSTTLVGAMIWLRFLLRWLVMTVRRSPLAAGQGVLWKHPGEWWGGWAAKQGRGVRDRSTACTSIST